MVTRNSAVGDRVMHAVTTAAPSSYSSTMCVIQDRKGWLFRTSPGHKAMMLAPHSTNLHMKVEEIFGQKANAIGAKGRTPSFPCRPLYARYPAHFRRSAKGRSPPFNDIARRVPSV
jgi:hypothetical protein